jgi:nitrate reductase gamma subunit
VPESVTESLGIQETTYRWFAGVAGGIAAIVTVVGFVGLVYRRATSDRVRRTTTRMDLFTYLLLTVLIVLGCWMTFGYTLATDHPYNYRDSIGEWWRSLFYLDPDVNAALDAPLVYQLHAIIAWAFWGAFAFSRLVHAWSIPLQYLGRPYILYRRRYPASGR